MLTLQKIDKTFQPGTVNAHHALRGVDLTLSDGEFVTIIGSNGAGKSTLLSAIAGSFFVDRGHILLDGEDLTYVPEHKRARRIARIFAPLGFGDWRAATALLAGFSMKEAVVSTFAVLSSDLSALFTPLTAFAFLIFTLLYTPCVAAVGTVRKELNTRAALGMVAFQTGFAWVMAFLVYHAGLLLGL